MGLKTYKSKRHLDDTPEPSGGKKTKGCHWTFVIQKHAARQLHYDLRLEFAGVLKSWAVPKGPPLEAGEKRLAIQVEDHPLEYGEFEGVIPAGNYGAGTVEIWDKGTYHVEGKDSREQEKNMREELAKGHIGMTFSGKKLKGHYALVRMASDPEGKQWLLIKSQKEGE